MTMMIVLGYAVCSLLNLGAYLKIEGGHTWQEALLFMALGPVMLVFIFGLILGNMADKRE